MTHEEIVKEFRKIEKYLHSRAKDIKTRYGDEPDFASEKDEWHYKLLMQVCQTIQERKSACLGAYMEVQVPDINYARNRYGIEI